jgi:protein-tyrosine phosphatase
MKSSDLDAVKVLFICMGNICRSPVAEAVFRRYVEQAGLREAVVADSAGTGDWHLGEPPDHRAQEAARRRGYDMSGLRARQISPADYGEFDYLLAMDEANLRAVRRSCPAHLRHKVHLFGSYCSGQNKGCAVPDPYYGGPADFELVLDLAEDAARALLEHIREMHFGGRR